MKYRIIKDASDTPIGYASIMESCTGENGVESSYVNFYNWEGWEIAPEQVFPHYPQAGQEFNANHRDKIIALWQRFTLDEKPVKPE